MVGPDSDDETTNEKAPSKKGGSPWLLLYLTGVICWASQITYEYLNITPCDKPVIYLGHFSMVSHWASHLMEGAPQPPSFCEPLALPLQRTLSLHGGFTGSGKSQEHMPAAKADPANAIVVTTTNAIINDFFILNPP
jgi:hypothetical protein